MAEEKSKEKKSKERFVWKKENEETPYVETDIDRLHHLVQERKKIKVSEAAKIFKVRESEIEKWGQILHDHDLVQLHYPLIGDAVLQVREKKKK